MGNCECFSGKATKTETAIWAPGQKVQYYSEGRKAWYPGTVIGRNAEGGVKVNVDGAGERTVPKDKSATNLKPVEDTATIWAPGQKVQYYSEGKKAWFPGTVIGPNPEGGVKVDVDGAGEKTVPKDKLATNLKAVQEHATTSSLHIVGLGTEEVDCNLSGASTVSEVRRRIAAKCDVATACVKLLLGEIELSDSMSLPVSGSTLQLVMKTGWCKAPRCQELAAYTSIACTPDHSICDREDCLQTARPCWDGGQRHYCSWAHEQEAAEMDQPAFKPRSDVFLASVKVVPFGVLGDRVSRCGDFEKGYADPPDAAVAFVDPAGLHHIESRPGGAGGASGAAYSFLGIENDPAFPPEVKAAIRKTGEAKFHSYPNASCIHVVGPNFGSDEGLRDLDSSKHADRTKAVSELAKAYRNIFAELSNSRVTILRLLPVSGSIFAGGFQQQMHRITPEAIQEGFSLLTDEDQQRVRSCTIHLCIFGERDYTEYKNSLKLVSGLVASA